jgi:hypothetical protein
MGFLSVEWAGSECQPLASTTDPENKNIPSTVTTRAYAPTTAAAMPLKTRITKESYVKIRQPSWF